MINRIALESITKESTIDGRLFICSGGTIHHFSSTNTWKEPGTILGLAFLGASAATGS